MSPKVQLTEVKRRWLTAKSTVSEVFVDGKFVCYALEDVYRGGLPKVKAATAIPVGEYGLARTWSPKYQRDVYEVLKVPGFVGIRVHSGNDASHTEGCLLPGLTRKADFVGNSKSALEKLEALWDAATKQGTPLRIRYTVEPAE